LAALQNPSIALVDSAVATSVGCGARPYIQSTRVAVRVASPVAANASNARKSNP
jgi:hypothetical protein